jgi:hypothetical protein
MKERRDVPGQRVEGEVAGEDDIGEVSCWVLK